MNSLLYSLMDFLPVSVEQFNSRDVQIPARAVLLDGTLTIPPNTQGIVLFAHGSGSSRHSPRNRFVAKVLNKAGLATLLMDLLTRDEEAIDMQTRQLRFNIGLLAERLVQAVDWLAESAATRMLVTGCFGASTGAAAALIAAAERPVRVAAVVSRGGRPDLAEDALTRVQAPTLLIVGGQDHVVIDLNRQALAQLRGEKKLEVIPGATHLFEERGALEAVAQLATEWFLRYLKRPDGFFRDL